MNCVDPQTCELTTVLRIVTFTYDDLYRLLSVSVTGTPAGIEGYEQTLTYDALGNITNKSDIGDYTYGTEGYANPDAAIQIGTTSLAYDENGNLTSMGSVTSFQWDYRNRLTQVADGTSTSTYAYDPFGQRVKTTVNGTSTYYPNKYYNTDGTTATKHIFANGELIATITSTGTATFIHTDHLGGTNVATDENGEISQLLDYYPYGSPRLNEQTGFNEQRTFIGEQYDPATNLSYLNARYYYGSTGKFLSQDPVLWDVGQTKVGTELLNNPQLLNSYSYAANNPIIGKDADGKLVELVSRPIEISKGRWFFGHTFLKITPDNPGSLGSIGIESSRNGISVDTSKMFTLSGYSDDFNSGDLYKVANLVNDYQIAQGNLSTQCWACAFAVSITPPEGVSQEEFERNLVLAFNELSNSLNPKYSKYGQPKLFGGANSNNATTSFLMGAGLSQSQLNSYQWTLSASNFLMTPGLGQPVSSQSTTYVSDGMGGDPSKSAWAPFARSHLRQY